MTILKLIYCKILISKIPRRMDNLRRLTLHMETLAINLQVMINFRRSNLHIAPLRCKMIMLHTIKFRLISHQEGVKAIISNNTQFRTIAVSNTILFQEKLKIRSCITRIIWLNPISLGIWTAPPTPDKMWKTPNKIWTS